MILKDVLKTISDTQPIRLYGFDQDLLGVFPPIGFFHSASGYGRKIYGVYNTKRDIEEEYLDFEILQLGAVEGQIAILLLESKEIEPRERVRLSDIFEK